MWQVKFIFALFLAQSLFVNVEGRWNRPRSRPTPAPSPEEVEFTDAPTPDTAGGDDITDPPTADPAGGDSTDAPTVSPTVETPSPTPAPSPEPTPPPTVKPTLRPTRRPRPTRFPTKAPVRPTPAPVRPTPAPVRPTPAPVRPTPAPVQPTRAPVQPTRAPVPAPVQPPTFAPVAQTSSDPLKGEWVTAHNTRRRAFYASYGLSPKDLKWSETLAASAFNYSKSLLTLSGCTINHGYQGNRNGGENLAANWGGSDSLTPEQVVKMWFDDEKNLPYGQNGHYTQVAWRGSSYFGCGIAGKKLSSGSGWCYIQTCRYMAPGNCNINAGNFISQALKDTSPCNPQCPPEGCF